MTFIDRDPEAFVRRLADLLPSQPVAKIAALVPISDEWTRNPVTLVAEDLWGLAMLEVEQRQLDLIHGPRLGPGRDVWLPIVERRLSRMRCSIAGKRPGRWRAAR